MDDADYPVRCHDHHALQSRLCSTQPGGRTCTSRLSIILGTGKNPAAAPPGSPCAYGTREDCCLLAPNAPTMRPDSPYWVCHVLVAEPGVPSIPCSRILPSCVPVTIDLVPLIAQVAVDPCRQRHHWSNGSRPFWTNRAKGSRATHRPPPPPTTLRREKVDIAARIGLAERKGAATFATAPLVGRFGGEGPRSPAPAGITLLLVRAKRADHAADFVELGVERPGHGSRNVAAVVRGA